MVVIYLPCFGRGLWFGVASFFLSFSFDFIFAIFLPVTGVILDVGGCSLVGWGFGVGGDVGVEG